MENNKVTLEKYWVSVIIQGEDDKRAWLSAMSDCELSLEDAKKVIARARENYDVLSAWIDMYDEEGKKNTVFHECYVNVLGNVEKQSVIDLLEYYSGGCEVCIYNNSDCSIHKYDNYNKAILDYGTSIVVGWYVEKDVLHITVQG